MKLVNSIDGAKIEIDRMIFLWILIFGSFYFAYKGIWTHSFISIILLFLTSGISWLIYPFFGFHIVKTHYINNGWMEEEKYKEKVKKMLEGMNNSTSYMTSY